MVHEPEHLLVQVVVRRPRSAAGPRHRVRRALPRALRRARDPATKGAEWIARLIISIGDRPLPDRPRRSHRRHPLRGDLRPARPHPASLTRRRLTLTRPTAAAPTGDPMSSTTGPSDRAAHRSRRHQRHRGHPLGVEHRRRRAAAHRQDNADAIFTWDYEKGARPALRKLYEKAKTAQWNGTTDLPWDTEVDSGGRRHAERGRINAGVDPAIDDRHARREVGRQGVARVRHRAQQLDAQPVPARRAGRAALHRQDRRDRAVVRRQALRVHAGDGRGPPRRGLRPVPRREARRATTRSTPTCACCSTTSSTTAAGT